jgi:polar amino acid transport system substrate-binding protein
MKNVSRLTVWVLGSSFSLCVMAAEPLRTAVDGTFAPHAMPSLSGGVQGFNVDLGRAIAKEMGRDIEIDSAEFSGLMPGLNARKYDFIVAPVTVTAERANNLLFTEGYLDSDYTFVQKKGVAPITALEQLRGAKLAVNKGSNYEGWAKQNAETYGFKLDVYSSNADAIQALLSGRADANLSGTTVAGWAAKQNPQLQSSYTIKSGQFWAIAFRRDDMAGRDAANLALKCLKHNGTIVELAEKWFGFTPDAESAAAKVQPGFGVQGLPGYEDKDVSLECRA